MSPDFSPSTPDGLEECECHSCHGTGYIRSFGGLEVECPECDGVGSLLLEASEAEDYKGEAQS